MEYNRYVTTMMNETTDTQLLKYEAQYKNDMTARKETVYEMLIYFHPLEIKEAIERYLDLNDVEHKIAWDKLKLD